MIKYLLATVSLVVVTGCGANSGGVAGGTGVGNPTGGAVTISIAADNRISHDQSDPFSVDLLSAVSPSPALNKRSISSDFVDMAGTVFSPTSFTVHVDSISWQADSDTEFADIEESSIVHVRGNEVILVGPWDFDLLTGTIKNGGLLSANIPASAFESVQFYMDGSETEPVVSVAGTTVHDSKTVPFRIELPFSFSVKFNSATPVTLGAEQGDLLSLYFNHDNWFSDVDFFSFAPIVNDTMLVNDTTVNVNRYLHQVRFNIRKSSVLKFNK